MHFSRLRDSERATRVCFSSLRGRRRSQSLQDQPVMVGNPPGVGVCGIGDKKETKKERVGRGGSLQASAASKRQLEIESTVGTCARSSVSKDSGLFKAVYEDR